MATKLQVTEQSRVLVLDGEVHFDDFVETDPSVRRVLAAADRPEEAAHTILRIGAQATLVAQTDLDAQVVERRFDGMSRGFDAALEGAVSRIGDLTTKLLDEDEGSLPRILAETKEGIAAVLGEAFDADSKSSAIAKIDGVLDLAVQRLDRNLRTAFDPDAADGLLSRTKREILEAVKEQAHDVRKELQELVAAVAASKARAEAVELTAIKGFSYEDVLDEGLASIAVVHGDLAERVGTTSGVAGTKHGDHLVTVTAEDTCGEEARFVLECKDRRLSMSKTMEELGKAIENHAARAGIAVFSRQELAPTPLPFVWSGNRAVLVYDKECPDDDALQLGYAWARWVCRRGLTADGTALDVGRIEAALTRASQALQRHQAARSCFTAATKKIDEGAGHVAALVDEVRTAMAELREDLNRN